MQEDIERVGTRWELRTKEQKTKQKTGEHKK
jgi:hypothetical protein